MAHFSQVFFDHTSVEFGIFKTKLTNCFIANDIKDEDKKKAVLITCLSDGTYKLLLQICLPKDPETLPYTVLLQTLERQFSPKKCCFEERKRFYRATQDTGEGVREFAARLQSLAASCKFSGELDVILRDIFVIGLTSEEVLARIRDVTNLDVTFEKIVELAALKETLFKELYQVTKCVKRDDNVEIPNEKPEFLSEKPANNNIHTRSWWIDLAAKFAVFLLVFFVLNNMMGCSQTSLVFALAATYIVFYV